MEVDKLAPGGTATLTRSAPDGTNPTTFTCSYTSRFLRTIDWEVDALAGTEPPAQYATTSEPYGDGKAKRIITVQSAYAAAGIEVRTAGTPNVIAMDGAGADLKWSDAELHAAMEANFSLHRDTLQWKLWTFIASESSEGIGLRGCMFDWNKSDINPRQGMAVFYDELAKETEGRERQDLRTYVHEMGHALNLAHTFDRDGSKPPRELGPRNGYGDPTAPPSRSPPRLLPAGPGCACRSRARTPSPTANPSSPSSKSAWTAAPLPRRLPPTSAPVSRIVSRVTRSRDSSCSAALSRCASSTICSRRSSVSAWAAAWRSASRSRNSRIGIPAR